MRIRLHWLLIATPVLSIICWLGAMWALERANRRAYARDTQALVDAGFVMDWDTVAAEIAPADPAALATWTAWCAHAPAVQEDSSLNAWIRNGRGAPPPAAQELVETHRAAMASVLPLVREGRLQFGIRAALHGWLSGPRDPDHLIGVTSLLGARTVAYWLRWQALTADDPTPWLEDLDRLVAAGEPPLSLIDGMIGIAIATIRDETRFAHIRWLEGRLDDGHPWLTPIDDLQELNATMWMGERLFNSAHIDRLLHTGDRAVWSGTHRTWQDTLLDNVAVLNPLSHWQWATLPSGGAFLRWTQAKQEADLRGNPPPPPLSGVGGEGNMIAAIALPNYRESHIALGEHHLRARILRVAARLFIDHRDGAAIPTDAAELTVRYGNVLAALPGSVPVLYTREADGGFTLAGDITVPISTLGTLRNDQRLTVPGADLALEQP